MQYIYVIVIKAAVKAHLKIDLTDHFCVKLSNKKYFNNVANFLGCLTLIISFICIFLLIT